MRINNNYIKRDIIWYAGRALQITTTTIIEDLTCTIWQITHYDSDYYHYSRDCIRFIDIITYWYELCKIYKYDIELQNYHFAPGGNFLNLISKNYYKIIFTRILWIFDFYNNLTNF